MELPMPRATATEIVTDAIASDNLWKAWKLLIDRLRSVDTEDEQNLLLNMIDVATFETIWKNIIESTSPSPSSSSSSSSSTMCCYEASQFLLSYRLLSNIFSKHSKGIILITYEKYSRLLIYSLLCAAEKYNLFACRSQTLSRIINALSLGYHSLLLHFICNEIKCVNHLLAIMSGGWALKSLQILLKHSRATNPVSKDEAYYCSVLQSFIQKAELDIEPIVIIEELTLMYPASEIFSIVVMEYFRPNHLRLLIERISLLWGQPLFIAQGNEPMQRHLHFMLEWLLMRMNDPSILTSHSDISNSSKHTPLAVLLTRGVSAQLDSTDRPTRARAARIAKLFSSLLGHELNLSVSEEDTEKKPEGENATATAITSTGSSNDKHKVVLDSVVNKSEEGDDSDNNNDNNSDIDSCSEFSELEAFEIVEDKPVGDGSTVYLRKCLEMLRCPESQEDAYQKHNCALTSIPTIVASAPVDGLTMAAPLVRELLRMQNAFNMEHFKDLQSTAVRALLVAYPGVAVPVITGSIVSGASQADITLGGKLAALSDLILTAHALANHEMKDTFETRVSNKLTAAPTTNNSESASLASSTNSKTRVKRPAKLAQYKALMSGTTTTSSSSVNRFGPVAQLFFQPVLRILMSILRRPLTTAVLIPSVSHASVSNENQRTGLGAVGDDDTDSLLVAQCLLAIGAFVRCSINTRNQRNFILEGLKVSLACRSAASLTIRRAQLSALLSCMESWLLLIDSQARATSTSTSGSGLNVSALGQLTGISGGSSSSGTKDSGVTGYQDLELMMLVTQCLDWIMTSAGEDPDIHSRVLKVEILRMASIGLQREDNHTD